MNSFKIDAVSGRRIPSVPRPQPGLKRIRGASGLGDSVYLRVVCDHYVRQGDPVIALSDYPDVFIGSGATVEPFRRDRVDIVAHYVLGKPNQAATQWDDVRRAAGIVEALPLAFPWTVRNAGLIERLRLAANGRPIIMVHGGRVPMGRTDGFGMEILPERQAFEAALSAMAGCFTVRIGKADQVYPLPVTVDLNGGTSVSDLLDLVAVCDGVVAQCSFAVPMAEAFDKPLLAVWASRGLASRTAYIRQITPRKILSKPTSRAIIDDAAPADIAEASRCFIHETVGATACAS